MDQLPHRVHSYLTQHHMVATGETVVVGVSGGPDSLCLLHVLKILREHLRLTLHVAHLDHMLRGAESAADAAFVAQTAHAWGLPVTIEAIDVGAHAQAQHLNLPQAAREIRYAFLARVAQAQHAQAVAVAHTANDQAETVLLHLLRGAGTAGLRGMRPVVAWEAWMGSTGRMAPGEESQDTGRPRLIRPLLDVTRDQIEQYCTEHHLQPRRDPTNVDRHYTRNRIRHELLPQLIEYNPHIVTALSRTAAICADDYAFIQTALAEVWDDLVRVRAGGIDFAGHVWQTLHPALQREALRKAHKLLVGNETLTLDQIEHARAMIERGVGRRVELPGALTLTVGYAGAFTIGTVVQHGPQLPVQQCVLPVPGQIRLEHGWRIETAYGAAPPGRPHTPWEVYLDAEKIGGPLLVRRRRPGDRVRLAGKSGSRRVQDLFVDAKVPRALRDAWPIVVAADMIVWVAGVRAADDVVATATARQVVRIRVSDENLEHNA